MLPWIDCGIVYLSSHSYSSCCIGLIVTFLSVFSWIFLMLPWIDCGMVYLSSHSSSTCCIGLIVTLFIYVLMALSHFALDWVWHCLSVFSWLFLMLHWIDCVIVYLCFHGSSSCCISWLWHCLSVFSWFLLVVLLDWLWHCLSVLSWFVLMSHWIECFIVYLCSHDFSSCCLGLSMELFICVLMFLPRVALDWL